MLSGVAREPTIRDNLSSSRFFEEDFRKLGVGEGGKNWSGIHVDNVVDSKWGHGGGRRRTTGVNKAGKTSKRYLKTDTNAKHKASGKVKSKGKKQGRTKNSPKKGKKGIGGANWSGTNGEVSGGSSSSEGDSSYGSSWSSTWINGGKWSVTPTLSPTFGSTGSSCQCEDFSDRICANCFEGTGFCADKVCVRECCEVKTCECDIFTTYKCKVCSGDMKGTCPDDVCAAACCDSSSGSYGSYRNSTSRSGNGISSRNSGNHTGYNSHGSNYKSHSAWASASQSDGEGLSGITMYVGFAMMIGTAIAAMIYVVHHQTRRVPSDKNTASPKPLARVERDAPIPRMYKSQHMESPSLETGDSSFYGAHA